MASVRSLYDVLNVSHDAEGVVIEAAYRALMKKYHPDQAPGGQTDGNSSAAEINQAFAVLRDPKRRAGYDLHERGRQQPVQLAAPPVLEQRRNSGFTWTGWLVALLLGAILYAVLSNRGGLIVPPPPGNDSAAAEPDHRTQPIKIAPAMEAASTPTALDREILLSELKAAHRDRFAREEEADIAANETAADGEIVPVVVDPPAELQLRARTPPPRPHARVLRRTGKAGGRSREDEDFLKREGYIY